MEHKNELCDAFKPLNESELKPIDCFSLFLYKIFFKTTISKPNKLCLIFIFVFIFSIIGYKPVNGRLTSPSVSSDSITKLVDFLVRFGYLPKGHKFGSNLRSEDQLKNAIKQMQTFGNLNPTGIIDKQTLELMSKKRCGVPDIIPKSGRLKKRYTLHGNKWNTTDLTWSVRDWMSGIDAYYALEEFRKAFSLWADVSKLTFTETRKVDADIVISFKRGDHGDNMPFVRKDNLSAKTLAHAFFPGDDIGGDVHFNADEWENMIQRRPDDPDWQGISLFSAAAHEFGHSLGLMHSAVPGALMGPYYQTISEDYKLPDDDTSGIQRLYGPPNGWTYRWTTMTRNTPKYPTKPITSFPKYITKYPNPCNLSSIDAIASIRTNIFIFKSKYFWWLRNNKNVDRTEPIEINHYWMGLPNDLSKVDAVFERHTDRKIVFFIGKQYYVFKDPKYLDPGYPKPLTSIGIDESVERIDAAMIWSHNANIYLFSGSNYWKFDEKENKVISDYPRKISTTWTGVPNNIDAAFQWSKDSQTYFFKGRNFWKFDDRKMNTSYGYPQKISKFWFEAYSCPDIEEKSEDKSTTTQINATHFSIKIFNGFQICLFSVNTFIIFHFYIFNVLYN